MTTSTSDSTCIGAEVDKRTRYSPGMIVGAADLMQDQCYLAGRDNLHQRGLHGWGVVAGLAVAIGDANEVQVLPGTAIDAFGRTICVEQKQCADLAAWINSQEGLPDAASDVEVWVSICFDQQATDPLPIPGDACRSLDESLRATRTKDSFQLQLSLVEPPRFGEELEIEAAGGGASNILSRLTSSSTLAAKRRALSSFVTNRGQAGFDNSCLDPLTSDDGEDGDDRGDGCVPLAKLTVPIAGSARAFRIEGDIRVTTTVRPVVVSTYFLREWLLRTTGGSLSGPSPVPATPSLDELTDVSVAGASPGSVLVRSNLGPTSGRAWQPATLNLATLNDVSAVAPAADTFLGFDAGEWKPLPLPTPPVPPPLPAPVLESVTFSTKQPIAIVAGGVLSIPGRVIAPGGDSTWKVLSSYGELTVASPAGRIVVVTFAAYADLFALQQATEKPTMVVKATVQAQQPATIHVLGFFTQGIALGIDPGVAEDNSVVTSWQTAMKNFGLDGEQINGLHIEVTAFGDGALIQGIREID